MPRFRRRRSRGRVGRVRRRSFRGRTRIRRRGIRPLRVGYRM